MEKLELTLNVKWFNRFISVVLMTLLLAIVLSTATFAWYSVVNVVAVNDLEFTASSNDGGGGDLCLSWVELAPDEYSYKLDIAPVTEQNVLYPMVPINSAEVGVTKFKDFGDPQKFNKAYQIKNSANSWVVKLDNASLTTPYVLKEKNGHATEFFLTNKTNSIMEVTFTYEIHSETYNVPGTSVYAEYDIIDKFRGAIFTTDETTSEFTLRGLVSTAGQSIYYGQLENNKDIYDLESMSRTEEIKFLIPANNYIKAKIVVWFDGVEMVDEDGSKKIDFDIAFNGVPYAPEEVE